MSLFVLLALPALVSGDSHCSSPYECLPPTQCARRLHGNRTEVLFVCEDRERICCPPPGNDTRAPQPRNPGATTPTLPTNHTAEYHNRNHSHHPHHQHHHHHHHSPAYHNTVRQQGGEDNEKSRGNPSNGTAPSAEVNSLESHPNFKLLPRECGSIDLADRITEGDEAGLGEFPWMALVGFRDRKTGNVRWTCGGTLVNPRYVLTAAHCLHRGNRAAAVFRLGEHDVNTEIDCTSDRSFCLNSTQDFEPEEIILHEEWNSTSIKNDIALVRLSRSVPRSTAASSICLPFERDDNPQSDVKYEVAGWGITESGDLDVQNERGAIRGSNVLRKAKLSAVSNEDCNLCRGKNKDVYCPITNRQMCAQGWKFVDVCKGDSGGPLMIQRTGRLHRYIQVGITSFKASGHCGADNIPSVFTRVESYLGWILDKLRA